MIDEIDEQLLQLLQKNARQTSESLAKQLNVSSSTVRRRMAKLTENGILHIIAYTDPGRVGLPVIAVIGLNVAHELLDKAMQKLASRPEVVWISTVTGRFDIIAQARFRSTDALYSFMREAVSKTEGIKGSETFVCLRVGKALYKPV